MGSRREGVLAAVLIVLTVVLATLAAPEEEDRAVWDTRASSFRNSPHGARALYLLLRELEIPVGQRLSPYLDADSLVGPLALLAPVESPTPGELRELMRWIEAGGTLLYAARLGDATLDTLGLVLQAVGTQGRVRQIPLDSGVAALPRPHPWTEGMEAVDGFRWVFADTSRALRAGRALPLLATPRGAPTAVLLRRGGGRVVAWSDPRPLSNTALRESGAALLFARAAAEATAGGRALHFDEYHHGYRAGGGPVEATLGFLRETAPGHAALQLALVGFGLLVLLGRRFGAPLAPPPARRRSPIEHVEALAGAYRQADARATARRLLVAGLARRLGRPPPAPGREAEFLAELATRLPVGHGAAEALLALWRQGARADLAALTRQTDELMAQIQHS